VTDRVRTDDRPREWLRRGRQAGTRQVHQVRQTISAIDTTRVAATANQVGRNAVDRGGRAAKSTAIAVGEFFTGTGMFWRGMWTFVTRPRLWLYALLPAVILYLLTLASRVGVRMGVRWLADWAAGLADGWPTALQWVVESTVRWGLTGLANAVVGFLVVPLTLLVGAPFYVLIVRSLERRLGGPDGRARSGRLRATGFVLSQTVLLTLVTLFGGLVATPILLIPGVNLVAAALIALVVNGFVIGLLAVGLPLHHRGVRSRRRHFAYAWQRRWPIIGFGAMSVLILSIPFAPLRWLTVPAVFVGAVLLQRGFPRDAAGDPAGYPAARPTWPVAAPAGSVPATGLSGAVLNQPVAAGWAPAVAHSPMAVGGYGRHAPNTAGFAAPQTGWPQQAPDPLPQQAPGSWPYPPPYRSAQRPGADAPPA
jgi:CysZ protein